MLYRYTKNINSATICTNLDIANTRHGVEYLEAGAPHVHHVALQVLLCGEDLAAGRTIELEPGGGGASVGGRLLHAEYRAALTTRQAETHKLLTKLSQFLRKHYLSKLKRK
jgi:hypothetical protein